MHSEPQELLRRKRGGERLSGEQLRGFAADIAQSKVSDAQLGAFAMAVCLQGMTPEETCDLTMAMRDSGERLDWSLLRERGPILDKHSTGGVGDTVSLMLGPMLAACGAFVPMLSGRGLGHTGGTLDKLQAIPGYQCEVDIATLQKVVADTGVAIVGATDTLAPADRRLYAVRDITATVDSLPLITASILSKKLAAGTDALVLDVKHGSGASVRIWADAVELAQSLEQVAVAAGLPTRVLLTDMNQPLADSVGNALELDLALRYMRGDARPARLHAVTMALGAQALVLGGLAANEAGATLQLQQALDSGAAAARFARMAHALGGPHDLLERCNFYLVQAPIVAPVFALHSGIVRRIDARALGMACIALGGGRRQPQDQIDVRVGLSAVCALGDVVDQHTPLAIIHAADAAQFAQAAISVRAAIEIADQCEPLLPLIQALPKRCNGGAG